MLLEGPLLFRVGCGTVVLFCFAWIGFCLFGAIVFPFPAADTAAIKARHQEMCAVLGVKDYETTYQFMSAKYRMQNTFRDFERGPYSPIFVLEQACDFYILEGSHMYQSRGAPIPLENGASVNWVKENGIWYIDDAMYSLD